MFKFPLFIFICDGIKPWMFLIIYSIPFAPNKPTNLNAICEHKNGLAMRDIKSPKKQNIEQSTCRRFHRYPLLSTLTLLSRKRCLMFCAICREGLTKSLSFCPLKLFFWWIRNLNNILRFSWEFLFIFHTHEALRYGRLSLILFRERIKRN